MRADGMQLARVDDIVGFRIIVPRYSDIVDVVHLLDEARATTKIRDYCKQPQKTGYRGVHVVSRTKRESVLAGGEQLEFTVEIQLRTYYQHLWSLVSESYGEQVKEGGGRPEIRSYLSELSAAIEKHEREHPNEAQKEMPILAGELHASVICIDPARRTVTNWSVYKKNIQDAILEVFRVEDMAGGGTDCILLASGPDHADLKMTHASYLGLAAKQVPLRDWMPKPPI